MQQHPWILTATGRQFHFGLDDPNEFHIPDIARALSRICRYNGHLKDEYENDIYSVAQHSVYVLRFLKLTNAIKDSYQWGLLHDAIEAYWTDVPSPLKSMLPEYKAYESASEKVFINHYNIPYNEDIRAAVKYADYQILLAEAHEMTYAPELWDSLDDPHLSIYEIDPDFAMWRPVKARDTYLKEYAELGRED